jgi:hypothetical protein
MDTMDSEKKAIAENKVTKPSDNVLIPDQNTNYEFRSAITVIVLAITLLVASIYFGLLNL